MRSLMMTHYCSGLVLALAMCGAAVAQEATEAAKPTEAKTHQVKRGLFQIEIALDGVLEAKQMTPIVIRPKSWKEMTVVSAVAHGERVTKGQTLVTLDLSDLDRALADQTQALELAKLKLAQAEEEFKLLERSAPLDMEQVERAKKIFDEDLQLFFTEDLEQSRKIAEYSLKQSKSSLEYEQEELNQLEKMYAADDLTEETEEIVVKRQRDATERAKFYVAMAEREYERTLKYDLPRQEQSRKLSAELAAINYTRSKLTLPVALKQASLELRTQQVALEKSEKALADLQADRKLLEIVAPIDGVVYYGKCTAGQWTAAATVAERLQAGGNLAPNDVFMTIVAPGGLWLRGASEEKDLSMLRVGLAGTATPTALPDARLPAQLAEISAIPISSGKFDAKFDVTAGEYAERLVAGMNAKLKLVAYRNESAVLVPNGAVFSDEATPDEQYVLIQTEPGKHEKRAVEIGHKNDKQAEIKSGLSGDETILAEKPAE
jgi:HlyD family secretion protein